MILLSYFNYHATAKQLIREGKLKKYFFTENYKGIRPALVLLFDDIKHPVMPIRENRWEEYLAVISEIQK